MTEQSYPSFKKALHHFMAQYRTAKQQSFAGHPLGTLMRQTLPLLVEQALSIDKNIYRIQGSVGQGNWATVPWLALLDKQETETTQKGVYIVYLFSDDMKHVYLTLNQGVTIPTREMGRPRARAFLQQNVAALRDVLPLTGMQKDNDIYLTQNGIGADYGYSTIAYYKYEENRLPNDEHLLADLRNVFENYQLYMAHHRTQITYVPKAPSQVKRTCEEGYQATLDYIKTFIQSQGFHFPTHMIENVYLSLKTKPFIILAGVSGTGKTKLVKLFAEALGATEENSQYALVPVRPDWHDPSDLLGYTDLHGVFRPGRLLSVIAEASKIENREKPYFVCLDEMNLARVEHYFSDLLSLLETRRWQDDDGEHRIVTDRLFGDAIRTADPSLTTLTIPDNVYLIGTVNMDETTYPFSKKVLDRANTIEFNEINLEIFPHVTDDDVLKKSEGMTISNSFLRSHYLTMKDAYTETHQRLIQKIVSKLSVINQILEKAHLHIGFRVRDEFVFYVLYTVHFDLMTKEEAFDWQLMQKILPRIQGSSYVIKQVLIDLFHELTGQAFTYNQDDIADEMLLRVQVASRYQRTLRKITYMVRRYEEDGFTSFWLS